MIHDLKCWPEPFKALLSGAKRHEIRVNDRPYAVGDILHLREWVPKDQEAAVYEAGGGWNDTTKYTGRTIDVEVTYMTKGGEWGLPDSLCVMSIRRTRVMEKPQYRTDDPATSSSTEFTVGQRVRTMKDAGSVWSYPRDSIVRWGVDGVVTHEAQIFESDPRLRLCYQVRHSDDGSFAYYEHEELEVCP